VLDLRPGASLVGALVHAGVDTWCLDWGTPEDEDRHLSWDDVHARLDRAARFVQRTTRSPKLAVLGYCMGATLSAIWAALHPERVASLVNPAGPIDFSRAGQLATLTRREWFDAESITSAGNITELQIQSGFAALRPTQGLAKAVGYLDRDEAGRRAFEALEAWANDNVVFPAAAYRTYVEQLYQQNQLFAGTHRVGGRPAELSAITAPTMVIAAERDAICPREAATALLDRVSSATKELLVVPGGHVGAVVGSRASRVLYPAIAEFVTRPRACAPGSRAQETPWN
jgi:polyhydroxyalkanoate synthase